MAKRKAKKKSKKGSPKAVPYLNGDSERQHRSVSVRKIKNGWLAEHSSSGGEDGYKSETEYHPRKPVINMSVAAKKARERRLEKVKI